MKIRTLNISQQEWPLAQEFRISRGAKTTAKVIVVELIEDGFKGTGESVPYARYDESIASVTEQLESVRVHIESGIGNDMLNLVLKAGAARNALDCALLDLEAKKQNKSVSEILMLKPFLGGQTAQTLSIASPEKMAQDASKLKDFPLVKIKLDRELVIERMKAINLAAPKSHFIIDANEGWTIEELNRYSEALEKLNVVLLEQPLPSYEDSALYDYSGKIPLCADESIHTCSDLDGLNPLYQFINIKLDKTGGLTEAVKLLRKAQAQKLGIMVGCMVGTSLSMAPASLLAPYAKFVDLDGPALLKKDRESGFKYEYGTIGTLNPNLWGGAITAPSQNRQYRFFNRL